MIIIFENKEYIQIVRHDPAQMDLCSISSNKYQTLHMFTGFYHDMLKYWEHRNIGRECEIIEDEFATDEFRFSTIVPSEMVESRLSLEIEDIHYTSRIFRSNIKDSENIHEIVKSLDREQEGKPPKAAEINPEGSGWYTENIKMYSKLKALEGVLELHGIIVSDEENGNLSWGYSSISQLTPPHKVSE